MEPKESETPVTDQDTEGTKPITRLTSHEEPLPVYANVAQIASTPFDIVVTFGRIAAVPFREGTERADELLVQSQVQVFMSPQHAKVLLRLLTVQITNYESKHGAIPALTGDVEEKVVASFGKPPVKE